MRFSTQQRGLMPRLRVTRSALRARSLFRRSAPYARVSPLKPSAIKQAYTFYMIGPRYLIYCIARAGKSQSNARYCRSSAGFLLRKK